MEALVSICNYLAQFLDSKQGISRKRQGISGTSISLGSMGLSLPSSG